MEKYGVNTLRRMFLEFFESKDHLKMKSFSLVPHNDNSLLIINSGMAPLKPYFTGQEIPPRRRVTTCQKCIRTGDIENVGKTARHGTFFEMLGNFSFGDYFKTEAIHWSWEFLTEVVGLDKNRLYPSIYLDDDEAFRIWNEEIGIPEDRIFRFGKEDNFWEHGAGPCGPCSEIYYDRGERFGCGKEGCTVGCDCDRYMEVWNNVFTQFENDGNGNYTELVQKNIDTGMGLERLAVVVQDVDSIFDVDTLYALRNRICQMAGTEYHSDEKKDVSIRVITDHIRSVTFMISDGIMPSNEGRGYVLRRLLRRAARHGRLLGIEGTFLADLSDTVVDVSCDGYPELREKQEFIKKVISVEEDKFNDTIDLGLGILTDMIAKLESEGGKVLDGEDVFRLYDTYGFPLDLTKEILEEKGIEADEEGFKKCMEVQRTTARAARKTTNYMGADVTIYQSIDAAITSTFVGYDRYEHDSVISVLASDTEITDAITDGMDGMIMVDETPFYATMGGQEGDTGVIVSADGEFKVIETKKLQGGKIAHFGKVTKGMFKVGDKVTLKIDSDLREDTCKNHSATHLLQKALRTVLGTHVEQQGSLVTPNRLRFDFSHFQAMTAEELEKVEKIVSDAIADSLEVKTEVMSLEDAKKTGAMALFGEKYGDEVRVVSMGDFSVELCGGTHVSNTSKIGLFKIVSESGIAAGIRRIEAITGSAVVDYYKKIENSYKDVCALLKTDDSMLMKKIHTLLDENKELRSENESLKDKINKASVSDAAKSVTVVSDMKVLALRVDDSDMNSLRKLCDDFKANGDADIIVVAGDMDGKVNLVVASDDAAIAKGFAAGKIIKQAAVMVGGGGGGRDNMATAGGKKPEEIDNMLKAVPDIIKGIC